MRIGGLKKDNKVEDGGMKGNQTVRRPYVIRDQGQTLQAVRTGSE